MSEPIYFLVSVSRPSPGRTIPKTAVMGFFDTQEEAEKEICSFRYRENTPFRYLVIEKSNKGIENKSELVSWYKANEDGVYKLSDYPQEVNFGISSFLKIGIMVKPSWIR